MPLVNLRDLLQPANSGRYAVAAFDVLNAEMAYGVLKAAEDARSPLIFAYAEPFENLMPMEPLCAMLIDFAKRASIPVALHLDHATNQPIIDRAIACGFTSIMIDASDKPFEENIARTKEIVAMCHPKNISVEAELGHVSGNEGMYENDTYIYTDVEEAREFVKRTDIDALAVAIGSVHGVYKSTPVLNLERCEQIKQATDIPLVLHGGSGLSDDDFKNVIKAGINKVNIFTDLALQSLARLDAADLSGETAFIDVEIAVADAVRAEAAKKIDLFGSAGKA